MTSKLLFDEAPLVVQPRLAKILGLNEAIFVQQLHYWLQKTDKNFDGRPWVYNTYAEWLQQFPWLSLTTLRRVVTGLEEKRIVYSTDKYNSRPGDNTKWYTINYFALNHASVQNEQTVCRNQQGGAQNGQSVGSNRTGGLSKMSNALPESTTETNSDTGDDEDARRREHDLAEVDFNKAYEHARMKIGAPFLYPKDIQAIQELLSKGVTAETFMRGIDICFQDYAEKNEGGKISSVTYCKNKIWKYHQSVEQLRKAQEEVLAYRNEAGPTAEPNGSQHIRQTYTEEDEREYQRMLAQLNQDQEGGE